MRASFIRGKAETEETVQPGKEKAQSRSNQCIEIVRVGFKEDRVKAIFSGAQWLDKRQWAQTETLESPSEHQETLFYCEGD